MYISSTNNVSTTTSSLLDSLIKGKAQNSSTSVATTKDSASSKAAMRDLIDKVSAGTASESEIQELAAKLKEMAIQKDKKVSSSSESSSDTELDNLMEKIKNGTATSDEIKSVATIMKERAADMQAHFGGMHNMAAPSGTANNEMMELVDKVAAGTASDSEIQSLTDKLKEIVTKMQSLTSQSISTDDTSTDSDIASLLEKIKDGTATDDDIKAIATQIKENPPAKPPGDKPLDGVSETDSTSSTTNNDSAVMAELLQMVSQFYTNITGDSTDTTSSSESETNNKYAIAATNQLMESFMEAYSQDYNGVVTTAQKVIG